MMINVKKEEINRTKYVPIGIVVTVVLMAYVYMEFPETREVQKVEGYLINGGERNVE